MQTTMSHRWKDRYPELGTEPLPIAPLLDPQVYERQKQRVFKACWLHVGRVERLPKAGDFFVEDLTCIDASVLVVRRKDGTIGAFHNVCTHRGNKLVWEKSGSTRGFFACGFHGWVFNGSGDLVDVPDQENFYDLRRESCSLKQIRVDVWNGFIFITLNPDAPSLIDYLGELVPLLDGYRFDHFPRRTEWLSKVDSNWRVVMDAQVETYHVAEIHKGTAKDALNGPDNPHAHLLDYRQFDPHHWLSLSYNPNSKMGAVEALAVQYGSSILLGDKLGKFKLPKGLNPASSPIWNFDIIHIFPNFNLLLWGDFYLTHQAWPTSVNSCDWHVTMNLPTISNAAQRFAQEHARTLFRDAVLEDGSTHERTQEAMETGAIEVVYLKDEEIAIRHGYKMLDDYCSDHK